jgi:cytochrome c-type biogenesis protein CcmH/NrfG
MLKESAAVYGDAVRHAVDVPTMILVADVLQSEQRFADSVPLLQKAIDEDPRNPTALNLLGRALTATGKYEDAERVLQRSFNMTPNGFITNLLLASLYERQSKYELAENALLRALRSVPENEKRSLSRQFEFVGDGYMRTGKTRNAERAYRQALALDGEKNSLADKLARAHRS